MMIGANDDVPRTSHRPVTAATEFVSVRHNESGLVEGNEVNSNANKGISPSDNPQSASMATPNTLTACQWAIPEDVCKSGYMRKYKNNHRKYFVLRTICAVDISHATLSYYDNEKKFLKNSNIYGQVEGRTTLLRDVFGIDRKFDLAHKYVMAVYTKTGVLSLICDDETQLEEWMSIIQFILLKQKDPRPPFHDFEHIWQINIKNTELGKNGLFSGQHRICLRGRNLYIICVQPKSAESCFEDLIIPIGVIRKYGLKYDTFFLELGRSSPVGAGVLKFTTENPIMSEYLYTAIAYAIRNVSGAKQENSLAQFQSTSSCRNTDDDWQSSHVQSSSHTLETRHDMIQECDPALSSSCSSINARREPNHKGDKVNSLAHICNTSSTLNVPPKRGKMSKIHRFFCICGKPNDEMAMVITQYLQASAAKRVKLRNQAMCTKCCHPQCFLKEVKKAMKQTNCDNILINDRDFVECSNFIVCRLVSDEVQCCHCSPQLTSDFVNLNPRFEAIDLDETTDAPTHVLMSPATPEIKPRLQKLVRENEALINRAESELERRDGEYAQLAFPPPRYGQAEEPMPQIEVGQRAQSTSSDEEMSPYVLLGPCDEENQSSGNTELRLSRKSFINWITRKKNI